MLQSDHAALKLLRLELRLDHTRNHGLFIRCQIARPIEATIALSALATRLEVLASLDGGMAGRQPAAALAPVIK
jgi:hypothetical protein